MRAVILGNGIAGYSAAKEIRSCDPDAEIIMISEEKTSTYLRPLLSKTYMKAFQKEKICMEPDEWYDRNRIRQKLGRRILGIVPESREILLDQDERVSYDRLVYALGADGLIPPFPGKEKPGVMTVRSCEDFDRMRRRILLAETAVIIGGGVIGIEMAWELQKMGCHVTILEAGQRLMRRVLDETSANLLAEQIRSSGAVVETAVRIRGITGDERADGVCLSDGRWYPADLIIVSCGVKPRTELAAACGIACDRGVLVDETFRTSYPDIYAAGDCIQMSGGNPSLWGYAGNGGTLAGYNLCHPKQPKRQEPELYPILLNAFGTGLFCVGDVDGEGVTSETLTRASEHVHERFRVNEPEYVSQSYVRKSYRSGRLCGAVLIGDLSEMQKLKEEIMKAREIQVTG